MNERIAELAEQAAQESAELDNDTNLEVEFEGKTYAVPATFISAFAELIVRECAKFAYQYVDGNETLSHYREKDWKELPGDIEFCMKVHFGVEE